jgi:hypothetical protein
MLTFLLLTTAAAVLAAALLIGLILALSRRWFGRSTGTRPDPAEPIDAFVAAKLDQAAADWAQSRGRPEAAHIMADKLRLLHRLAQKRGEA